MLNMHIISLAFLQGLTEFLPISSSGHLIILPKLMDWPEQGVNMDISMHIGTLIAVIAYFMKDVLRAIKGVFVFRKDSTDSALALKLIIAVIPILAVGFVLKDHIDEIRNIRLVAYMLICFGIVLYLADRFAPSTRTIDSMSYRTAFFIGLAQCLSLIAGVSRSGITMTTARLSGVKRTESAAFSMLLSIPTIGAAGLWMGYKMYSENIALSIDMLFAILYSALFGFFAIWLLMSIVKKCSFLIFAVYRVILGLILLAYSYDLV